MGCGVCASVRRPDEQLRDPRSVGRILAPKHVGPRHQVLRHRAGNPVALTSALRCWHHHRTPEPTSLLSARIVSVMMPVECLLVYTRYRCISSHACGDSTDRRWLPLVVCACMHGALVVSKGCYLYLVFSLRCR